jgi:endoglucanase
VQRGLLRALGFLAISSVIWSPLSVVGVITARPLTTSTQADAAIPVRPALSQLITADGAVAYWPLQDSAGDRAADVLDRHNGIRHGRVAVRQLGPGPTAFSYGFDGATAYVTAPSVGLDSAVSGASAWVRVDPRTSGARAGVVIDAGGITLSVLAGRAVARACAAGATCTYLVSRAHIADGAWHQIAFSAKQGTGVLYVDGGRDISGVITGTDAPARGGTITIGAGLRGNIDEVALFPHALSEQAVATQFNAGACPQAAGTVYPQTSAQALPVALPLHTSGRFIVDRHGDRVKLAGVNWYGAEELDHVPAGLQCQSADAIAAHIAAAGFNIVRLPWATATWLGRAPAVPPVAVAGDAGLRGKRARAVFDAVVAALARHGLLIVLDNHVSRPGWCCHADDGNALWWEDYNAAHPPHWAAMSRHAKFRYFARGQGRWLRAWRNIATRYTTGVRASDHVIGADLRNELRSDGALGIPVAWRAGRVPAWQDWPRAAERAGNALLRINHRILVMVEGVGYSVDFRGAATRPIRLRLSGRLVYSPHDYSWEHRSPAVVRTDIDKWWGWLLIQHRPWTAPVWVGEYGTCHPEQCGVDPWFTEFLQYLRDGDIDWTYWSINGTSARADLSPTSCATTPRSPGCAEGYGVSDSSWGGDASAVLTADLRSVQAATQR